jgi:hypothetical protein
MMYSEVMLMEMLGMLRSIPSPFPLPINQSFYIFGVEVWVGSLPLAWLGGGPLAEMILILGRWYE